MAAQLDRERLIRRARSGPVLRAVVVFVVALWILFVADGSRQPTSGVGWRILGYQRGVAGQPEISVIDTQATLDVAWDRMRIRSAPVQLPADATTFWVTGTGTIGCPTHLADVRTDVSAVTVVFTLALTTGCDRLKVPDSFLVSVDRGRLPTGAYTIRTIGPDGQSPTGIEIRP